MKAKEAIAQIRAEIERKIRENEVSVWDSLSIETVIENYKEILSFLDSLQVEEPEVDLNEEIDRFLKSEESTTYENAGSYKVAVKDPKKIARYFYELGCRHTAEEADRIEFERQEREDRENRGNFPEPSSNFRNIKGWVARDNNNGEVYFYSKKPQKFHEEGLAYWANGGYQFMLPHPMQGMFWKLCTTDEPIEVELTINRV